MKVVIHIKGEDDTESLVKSLRTIADAIEIVSDIPAMGVDFQHGGVSCRAHKVMGD